MNRFGLALLASALSLTGCTIQADDSGHLSVGVADAITSLGQTEATFSWRGHIETGRTLEIKGINGAIAAEPAAGSEIEVDATKRGRRNDPEEVRIEVVEHDDGVTICAVYPDEDGEPNVCLPGDAGHLNARHNDVKVDFTVKVPNGVRFVGRTVNGKVEAHDLTAGVDARTVNGSVSLSTRGPGTAHTVNGSIRATVGDLSDGAPLEFDTVNGSITLNFAVEPDATVEARTVNGSISTDYPLTVEGRWGPKKLSGKLGAGGRRIELSTVNGSIALRRSS